MNAALRPYITTGVALVGAGVIAMAPMTPISTDLQVHSSALPVYQSAAINLLAQQTPQQVYNDVLQRAGENAAALFTSFAQNPTPILSAILANLTGTGDDLTRAFTDAAERSSEALQNDVPELLAQARKQFDGGDVTGGVSSLLAALVAPVTPFNGVSTEVAQALGEPFVNLGRVITALAQPQFTTGLVLSLVGPVISTVGATSVAIQRVVDALGSNDPNAVTYALAIAPATILDGLLNGGYGPDLSPLMAGGSADPSTAFIARRKVLAGGLLSGVQVVDRETASLADRADAVDPDARILPGPIGGLQAVRLTVARAISNRKFVAANDATLAQAKSVTLNVAADQSASGDQTDLTPKAPTDSTPKKSRTLGLRAGSHPAASVHKAERVGKHRKADSK
jgi:hypothetical protein